MPKRVDEYITEQDAKDYCSNCNEICSRHCPIWRKASHRYDEEAKKEEE